MRYSRIAEEQEVQEGVGPEEVDEGPAQTPACRREYGEAGEEQQDGAEEGDLPPLRSLGWGEIGQDGALDGGHRSYIQSHKYGLYPTKHGLYPHPGKGAQQPGKSLVRSTFLMPSGLGEPLGYQKCLSNKSTRSSKEMS